MYKRHKISFFLKAVNDLKRPPLDPNEFADSSLDKDIKNLFIYLPMIGKKVSYNPSFCYTKSFEECLEKIKTKNLIAKLLNIRVRLRDYTEAQVGSVNIVGLAILLGKVKGLSILYDHFKNCEPLWQLACAFDTGYYDDEKSLHVKIDDVMSSEELFYKVYLGKSKKFEFCYRVDEDKYNLIKYDFNVRSYLTFELIKFFIKKDIDAFVKNIKNIASELLLHDVYPYLSEKKVGFKVLEKILLNTTDCSSKHEHLMHLYFIQASRFASVKQKDAKFLEDKYILKALHHALFIDRSAEKKWLKDLIIKRYLFGDDVDMQRKELPEFVVILFNERYNGKEIFDILKQFKEKHQRDIDVKKEMEGQKHCSDNNLSFTNNELSKKCFDTLVQSNYKMNKKIKDMEEEIKSLKNQVKNMENQLFGLKSKEKFSFKFMEEALGKYIEEKNNKKFKNQKDTFKNT